MKRFILIVGGGKVGANLTRSLLSEGYEIALVENNRHKFEDLEREFGHAVVYGDGTEIHILQQAGIGRADYVVSVTGDDEDNIIISQLAREKFGLQNVIARVNNPRNQVTFDALGIKPTVNSVNSLLSLIEHHLPQHRILNLLEFEEENIRLVELTISSGSRMVGMQIKELALPTGILLALIFRGREAVIPRGDIELQAEDHLVIIAESGRESELENLVVS
jgi:trk system potassium uptake protein TrkA